MGIHGERFPAQAAFESKRPKETSGERVCMEHAGAGIGGAEAALVSHSVARFGC